MWPRRSRRSSSRPCRSVAVLALRFDPAERASGRRLVGLLMGFGGVVVLVGVDVAGRPAKLLGAGAILLAAVGYAIGPMILKARLSDLDPRAIVAASLSMAALALTPLAALTPPTSLPSSAALVSVVVLGLFCTAAAFVLFGRLVNEAGPGHGDHLRRADRGRRARGERETARERRGSGATRSLSDRRRRPRERRARGAA